MVDRQDEKAVSMFGAYLTTYIHEQAELGPDPYQSPKIRPFDGTLLQDPLLDEDQLEHRNEGLLAISNDNSSSDEADLYDKPSHINTYWKPKQGKISIVTADLATSLAEATGCSFFPDHGANRVGISGANSNQALVKLKNLEGLQVGQPLETRSTAFLTSLDAPCFSTTGGVIKSSCQCSHACKSRTEHCHPVNSIDQRQETL
jgi:hypothetical protein